MLHNKPQQVFPWNIHHPRQTSRSHFVLRGHSSCFFFFAQLQPIASQCLEQQMRHNCSASQRSTLTSVQWLVSDGLACGKPAQVSWPSETPLVPKRLTSSLRVWRPQSSSSFIFHFSISKSKINLRVLTMFLDRRKVMFTSWHVQKVFLLTVSLKPLLYWLEFISILLNFLKSYFGYPPFPGLQLEIFHSFDPYSLLFQPTVMFSPLFRVVWMRLGLNYSLVCKEISQQLLQASEAHLCYTA